MSEYENLFARQQAFKEWKMLEMTLEGKALDSKLQE